MGDRSYGTTPASVEWVGENAAPGREVTFSFRLAGYRDRAITRTLTEEPEISVGAELTPIHVGSTGPAHMHTTGMMGTTDTTVMADPTVVTHDEDYLDNPY